MKKIIILSVLALCGCKLVNEQQMDKSQAAYVACLRANDTDEDACKVEKMTYDMDRDKWTHTKNGLLGMGSPNSIDVNVQQ